MSDSAPFEALVRSVAGKPAAMINLARSLLLPKGLEARARELCLQAIALAPESAEIRTLAANVLSHDIGSWYFSMVRDRNRHKLYAEAFRRILKPGCRVLDIGAGTGFFAMLAAREGAGEVIACERNPAVAEAAREIVALNGLADRVKIIAKASYELQIGVDLDGPADVLIWDNLANNLLGQGALKTVEDARRRLLTADADVIPARAEIRVALVEAPNLEKQPMGTIDGFDLSPFNRLMRGVSTERNANLKRISDAATLFDFDFTTGRIYEPGEARVEIAARTGAATGIAQWVRFHLSPHEIYDTGEGRNVLAFGTEVHRIEPFEARDGDRIALSGAHDRERLWLWRDRRSA